MRRRDDAQRESFPKSVAPYQAIPGVTPAPPDKYRQAAIEDRQRFIDRRCRECPAGRLHGTSGQGRWLELDRRIDGGSVVADRGGQARRLHPGAYRYTKAAQNLRQKMHKARSSGCRYRGSGRAGNWCWRIWRDTSGDYSIRIACAARGGSRSSSYGRNVLKAGTMAEPQGRARATRSTSVSKALRWAACWRGCWRARCRLLPVSSRSSWQDGDAAPAIQIATATASRDSGESMPDVVQRMRTHRPLDMTDYTLADALGKEEARKLAAQAKVPGEARDQITDFLTAAISTCRCGQAPKSARLSDPTAAAR